MINRHLLASRFALAFSVALLLSLPTGHSAKAQSVAKSFKLDSTVVRTADNGELVEYTARPFDFGPIPRQDKNAPRSLVISEEEKAAHLEKQLADMMNAPRVVKSNAPKRAAAAASNTSYAVGEIPLQEGMTPTGAKTYQIPITTAAGVRLVPTVALGYNSQAQEGWVGYGWDIAGYSAITIINKNKYYHGSFKGANRTNTDAVFALDGIPLVQNTQSATSSSYPLITATGNILVAPVKNSSGYVTKFNVKYPNGLSAVFSSIYAGTSYNSWSYQITELTDMNGGKITFQYGELGSYFDKLMSIRYGYNTSGQYTAEITFSYETAYGAPNRTYAGWNTAKTSRLKSITSKSDGNIICQYTLSYIQKDNASLLSQVDCTSGSESLPPVRFEYGSQYDSQTSSYLYKDNYLILSSAFTTTGSDDFVYRRGKFVSKSYNDGLIIYPQFQNYAVTASKKPFLGSRKYKFGSLYSPDQVILFAPSLSDFSTVNQSITAEEGFQTIEAVDVDGDGLDELVKVNFNGTSGSNTRLLITVYKCNSSGQPVQNARFEVQVQGTISSGDFTSPYRREYFWGDFRGNGKIQLLTVAYNNNGFDFGQNSYAALIDLSTHAKLCDSKLFDYSIDHFRYLLVCDLDNDSQTELCFTTSSGLDVYRFMTSSFSKERTVSGIDQIFWNYTDRPYFVTDMNGDGYIDILYPPSGSSTSWGWKSYNGSDFNNYSVNICKRLTSDEFMFIDVNQDGCADLVKINGTTLRTYINYGSQTWPYQQSPSTITNKKGIIPANVMDFMGSSCCFIKVDGFYAYQYKYTALSPKLRQLTKSIDSFGKMTLNSYVYLPEESRYWTDNSFTVNNSNGYSFRTLPIYVLSSEESYLSDSYANLYKRKYYSYFDGVVHSQGLGFCGFYKIRTYDYTDNNRTLIIDETHDPQKRGIITSVAKRHSSATSTPYLTVTNTYDSNTTTYGKLNPRLTKTVESNTVTGVTTTTTCTYGSYDLPTKVVTSRRIGSGTAQTETVTRTYQNTVSTSKYMLGMVTEESLVKEGDGDLSLSWKEKTVNTYDSYGRISTSKQYVGSYGERPLQLLIRDENIISRFESNESVTTPIAKRSAKADLQPYIPFDPLDPGDPVKPIDPDDPIRPFDPGEPVLLTETVDATNLVSETRWQYDSFGNITSEKTASYGATTFVGKTYTYDNAGRLLLTETDVLGHTTTYSGYNKFGKPTTIKDYRNRTTTCVYDAWGNLTKKTYPAGTVEQTAFAWGGTGVYTVTKSLTGKPQTITHFDALGREVRTGEKRFNGQWQYVDKVYDSNSRLQKASLPFRSSTASYWNTYTYDAYDRPSSVTEASGKVTTWSYSGASTTIVKDGISTTSTTDANGNVIRVVDAGGTITYTLRDDEQTASITAPGSVRTVFTYDEYGRKIRIVDPSAGTQTDSYVWNSDGSSVQTHVNANGTIKTYTDKYGRTTKVERPGEYTTTYTYNSYGLLTKEQSTNGTSKEYTYDSYDRVSTMKETVPDGKWLQKTYAYTSGSAISSIAYASQAGSIVSESYTYANGHNTKIALSNGTVVWNVTAENDLGMPTAVTTGSVTREYGYTAFGMPTYRRMSGGSLQDMRYQFDPQTGNLTMRRDETRGLSETFGYDNLNRLVSMGNRQISYDSKGNILSVSGVGSMSYGSSAHPYQVTSLTTSSSNVVANRAQSVSYTCYSRPSVLTEGSRSAAFTYNGDGDRVKMYEANGSTQVLTRYYIGGQYEFDQTPSGTKERLYLGGDAYSAPMVYQREGSGSWTAYNIGRDYLGNITHIATVSGSLVAEYSYDPWGRLRNPSNLAIYAPGNEPTLFLGRGFTGHEHLAWFGLINMNARLYDPVVGRFLSPDPYVQAPDFTQNFNRYSYALNNPLRYVDENGEWIHILIGAIIGGIGNLIANWGNCESIWEYFAAFGIGAAVGALSAVGGAWVAGVTKAAGVFAGAAIGAATGAVTGAASGYLLNGINNIVSGENFNHNWKSTVLSGALWGAIGGAVSGAIRGYSFAKENGANPWTNKIEGTDQVYERAVKSGIPTQTNPEEYCYAHSSAYADAGHGNHSVNDFIQANDGLKGSDVSALEKLSGAKLVAQGEMGELTKTAQSVGGALANPKMEILATIPGGDGKNHWVNVYKIVTATKLSSFGGKTITGAITSIGYWNPATGAQEASSSVLFFKVFKF